MNKHKWLVNFCLGFVKITGILPAWLFLKPRVHLAPGAKLCASSWQRGWEPDLTVNGISQRLEPGMMALVLTNQIHGFTPAPAAKFWVTVFSEEYVPLFAAEMKGKQGKTFVFAPSEAVTMLLKAKLIDQESSRLMRKACFYAVCEEYAASVDMEPRSNKTDFVVGRFLDYVAENYTKELSLRQLAQEFGYEYHYFSRLLSQQYSFL